MRSMFRPFGTKKRPATDGIAQSFELGVEHHGAAGLDTRPSIQGTPATPDRGWKPLTTQKNGGQISFWQGGRPLGRLPLSTEHVFERGRIKDALAPGFELSRRSSPQAGFGPGRNRAKSAQQQTPQ
jgi:hypothetical protein